MLDLLKDDIIRKSIPNDHNRQVTSLYYINYLFNRSKRIQRVIDLGCGTGNDSIYFINRDPSIIWVGLDIEFSPEVNARVRNDMNFVTFDGVNMPFADNSFDVIYCNQVLEHVRHPNLLLKEVERVLIPGGYLIGSVSSLEPYHSYSNWNYTVYGFALLIEEACMEVVELRPGIDAITLIVRRGLGGPRFFSRWWEKESPLNKIIDLYGKLFRKDHKFINATKLLFCGHFCFLIKKPLMEPSHG